MARCTIDCAGSQINLGSLAVLGPMRAVRWKSVPPNRSVPPSPFGRTSDGLDFIELLIETIAPACGPARLSARCSSGRWDSSPSRIATQDLTCRAEASRAVPHIAR